MNSALFIARKMIRREGMRRRFSRPIISIAVIAIAISLAVMILAIAIVTGFQNEIRNKVIGFGSHIRITSFAANNSLESTPMPIRQPFYPGLNEVDGVRHIQLYATKPGIIETKEEIQGIIAKGIGEDFDWTFFGKHLKEGHLMHIEQGKKNDSILISQYLARRLKIGLNDVMRMYFIPGSGIPSRKQFKVAGIYETGLEEFDQQMVMVDIAQIQSQSNWGVQAFLQASAGCNAGQIAVTATARGFYKNYTYDWGDRRTGPGPHLICPKGDTTVRVVIRDVPKNNAAPGISYPDTAWLSFHFLTPPDGSCRCADGDFETTLRTSGGSGQYYTGGFEVLLKAYEDLGNMDYIVYHHIGNDMRTRTILEQFPEIFGWLAMIDVNVYVIIVLMIVVAVINMMSTLLILILEKTNMIGILKAMGMKNWSIRKVFLYNAAHLGLVGMFWGNLSGIALAFLQKYFGIIRLPQENYYLSQVPINLQWDHLLLINLGTLVVCLVVLILPSYMITRIAPVQAIRFN